MGGCSEKKSSLLSLTSTISDLKSESAVLNDFMLGELETLASMRKMCACTLNTLPNSFNTLPIRESTSGEVNSPTTFFRQLIESGWVPTRRIRAGFWDRPLGPGNQRFNFYWMSLLSYVQSRARCETSIHWPARNRSGYHFKRKIIL